MSLSDRVVAAVLNDLQGRAGFDEWWDFIDADIQEEIVSELVVLVDGELRTSSSAQSVVPLRPIK